MLKSAESRKLTFALVPFALILASCTGLTGCLVAGYSSGGGFFIWPGSLGLLLLIAILFFVFRSR